MSSTNTFNLLLDDDNEDPSQLIAAQIKVAPPPKKVPASAQVAQPTKQALLPTKPLPPAQAVRDARNGGPRGGAGGGRGGGGRGFGRRGGREGGFNNDSISNENSFSRGTYGAPAAYRPSEEGDNGRRGGYGGPRGGGRGGRRFDNGEAEGGDRPRRNFERRSGTGRGNEIKRDGSGRGNWGSSTEEVVPDNEEAVNEAEKTVEIEKPTEQEQSEDVPTKENPEKEANVKEPEPEEDKEMTLEEYEKVREEKRKSLLALKAEERKVPVDKEFASMQLLAGKKTEAEIFVKLGSDKEKEKRKEVTEKERAKKSVSINEFLKPAEGEVYHVRGRGRGRRGGGAGGRGGGGYGAELAAAPMIDDTNFPSLGGK